ncbi:hypothetical protein [Pseudomonas mosselii]|uniref:hypothetical protein n=1 Tax=Pseudomonas mosselii TaxID=78327 RepID=UPI0027DBEE1D|nr:hypothetical protein [Pseudomonas mosselii]
MTSLFSTENLEFDPAKSVSINEVNSTFTEQSLHPLFGKGPLGGQATAAIARQQAREAVFMQRFSDMDIDKFQQVPQDDGDVWLVGMQTIDGEQHHVHISQNSLLDSVQLVEATAAEIALREKKYKIVTDEMSIEIDGKRYFVDSHIPFNFGFGGVTRTVVNFTITLGSSIIVTSALKELLSYAGGRGLRAILKDAVSKTWGLFKAVLRGTLQAASRFLRVFFSGIFNGQFNGLMGRCVQGLARGWRSAFAPLEEGAVVAGIWGAVLIIATTVILSLVLHNTRHNLTIYNLTSKDLVVSAPHMGHGDTNTPNEIVIKGYDNRGPFGKWYNASPIKSESKTYVSGIGLAMNLSLREPDSKAAVADFACMFDIPYTGTNSLNATAQKQDNIVDYYDANEGLNTTGQASASSDQYEIIVTYDITSGQQYDHETKDKGYIYNSMVIVREKVAA